MKLHSNNYALASLPKEAIPLISISVIAEKKKSKIEPNLLTNLIYETDCHKIKIIIILK